MSKFILSLIIPTYNCMDFLDETLGSVLPQLPDDYELVLVDDGSTDGTSDALSMYQEGHEDNVKVLLCEHKGVSGARNFGIEHASGRFVTFMDCDDCLMPGFFQKSRVLLRTEADLYIFSFERVEFSPWHSEAADGDADASAAPQPGAAPEQAADEDAAASGAQSTCTALEQFVDVGAAAPAAPEQRLVEQNYPYLLDSRVYESSSDFADEYVRSGHLLVYSTCNKFYRKDILDEQNIRFIDGLDFGEDRLFNYNYLPFCGRIVTSSARMFRYMQRNPKSASKRTHPDYYNTIMMLHQAKMDCFLKLSHGTSPKEKKAFEDRDLTAELENMLNRYDQHPPKNGL